MKYQPFFTILTGFPEIQARPTRHFDFLGSKIAKSTFFNFFSTKVFDFISNLSLLSAFFLFWVSINPQKQGSTGHQVRFWLSGNFQISEIRESGSVRVDSHTSSLVEPYLEKLEGKTRKGPFFQGSIWQNNNDTLCVICIRSFAFL